MVLCYESAVKGWHLAHVFVLLILTVLGLVGPKVGTFELPEFSFGFSRDSRLAFLMGRQRKTHYKLCQLTKLVFLQSMRNGS